MSSAYVFLAAAVIYICWFPVTACLRNFSATPAWVHQQKGAGYRCSLPGYKKPNGISKPLPAYLDQLDRASSAMSIKEVTVAPAAVLFCHLPILTAYSCS